MKRIVICLINGYLYFLIDYIAIHNQPQAREPDRIAKGVKLLL